MNLRFLPFALAGMALCLSPAAALRPAISYAADVEFDVDLPDDVKRQIGTDRAPARRDPRKSSRADRRVDSQTAQRRGPG
jgi:hypothetical protein